MRIFDTKKGMILILLLSIFAVFFFFPGLYINVSASRASFERDVGEIQLEILDKVNEGEADLFFIDQAARYTSIDILRDIENGFLESSCGKESNYPIWYDDKDCFLNKEEIIIWMEENIPVKLNNYLETSNFPTDNYDIYVYDMQEGIGIVGVALNNLNYNIISKGKIGEYNLKPSFDIAINYDLEIYERLKDIFLNPDGIINEVVSCSDQLLDCVLEVVSKVDIPGLELNVGCGEDTLLDSDVVCFTATSSSNYLNIQDGKLRSSPQEIKFVVKFPNIKTTILEAKYHYGSLGKVILKWNHDDFDYVLEYNDNKIIIGDPIELDVEPGICSFESIGTLCSPFTENNVLYRFEDHYYYTILIEEETNFKLDILDNAEIVETKQVLGKALDRLAIGQVDFSLSPGINKFIVTINSINENADGSPYSNDGLEYYVFAKKDNYNDLVRIENLKVQAKDLVFEVPIEVGPGDIFYVGIINVDYFLNPIKTEYVDQDNVIVVMDEYKEIINELSNPQEIIFS